MILKEPKTPAQKQKIYFVYFLGATIIVLIIFAFIIIGSYWNYWAQIWKMEDYYKGRLQNVLQKNPEISANDPSKGSTDAKVIIYEYSDFFCARCQSIQQNLFALEKLYGPKIRFIFKGLPITINAEARPALNAAYCANEQNKFWEFKDLLFIEPLSLNKQKYLEYAGKLGLNTDTFSQCLDSEKYYPLLNQNLTQALTLQISSVPTLYINNQKIEGYFDFNTLKNIVDQKLGL